MSKDLVRKTTVSNPERLETEKLERTKSGRTEVDEAIYALAEAALFGGNKPEPQGPPRIILALDCTSSMGEFVETRKLTPEAATAIAMALFAKVGPAGLEVQLAYFRGDGDDRSSKQPRQFRVSKKWYTNPQELARAMVAVEHWPGWTQHCRLLRHAVAEAEKQAIQSLIVISDAFEQRTPSRPQGDDLVAALVHARRLRDLGTKIFMCYKGTIRGGCPLDRAGMLVEQAFRDIAADNDGAAFLLSQAGLAGRFGEIASQAMLMAKGDAAAAQALLEHLRAVPFEMTVGEQASKCDRCYQCSDAPRPS